MHAHGVSFVHQHLGLVPSLTVLENLLVAAPNNRGDSLWGALRGKGYWIADERRLVEQARGLLKRFGMTAKESDYAGTMSGGQRTVQVQGVADGAGGFRDLSQPEKERSLQVVQFGLERMPAHCLGAFALRPGEVEVGQRAQTPAGICGVGQTHLRGTLRQRADGRIGPRRFRFPEKDAPRRGLGEPGDDAVAVRRLHGAASLDGKLVVTGIDGD